MNRDEDKSLLPKRERERASVRDARAADLRSHAARPTDERENAPVRTVRDVPPSSRDGEGDRDPRSDYDARARMRQEVVRIAQIHLKVTGTDGHRYSVQAFHPLVWPDLNLEHRRTALQAAERILADSQKRQAETVELWPPTKEEIARNPDHPRSIAAADPKDPRNSDTTLASFDATDRVIDFQRAALETATSTQALESLFHEARHSAVVQAMAKLMAIMHEKETRREPIPEDTEKEFLELQPAFREEAFYLLLEEGSPAQKEAYNKLRVEKDAERDAKLRSEIFQKLTFGVNRIRRLGDGE